MMNNISIVDDCTNCEACFNICPREAISVENENTFYSLSIDNSLCNECGLCLSFCPAHNEPFHRTVLSAYAGWHENNDIVKKSSSGGAFRAISDLVLSLGGVIFGAAYSDDYKSVVFCSTDDRDIDSLQKSKYRQKAFLQNEEKRLYAEKNNGYGAYNCAET